MSVDIWSDMFSLHLPVLEKILRPIIIYFVLIMAFKFFGRRELAQLNPLDLTVLLMLSNTVQNAIIGNDDSVSGGLIGAATLLIMNWAMNWCSYRWPGFERVFNGDAVKIIENGDPDHAILRKEQISRRELVEVLHREGLEEMKRVKSARLESSGQITVIPQDDPRIEEVLARMDVIETLLREGFANRPTDAAATSRERNGEGNS